MSDWKHHTGQLVIALGLSLGMGILTYPENAFMYASTIAVNSTYEVEVENMTSEVFERLMDAEPKIKQTIY